jgi:hypothetical protein
MTSLLFRLRGRSPHNSPLVTGPCALAKALNQKGGRGRPSPLRIELAPSSPRPERGIVARNRPHLLSKLPPEED